MFFYCHKQSESCPDAPDNSPIIVFYVWRIILKKLSQIKGETPII